MNCPNCHAELPDSAKFCTKCGTKIVVQTAAPAAAEQKVCANCGAVLKAGAKFCNKCGTRCAEADQPTVKIAPVSAVPVQPVQQPTYQQPVYQQPMQQAPAKKQKPQKQKKSGKKGGGVVLTIVIILLLVVILGLGGWLLWTRFGGEAGSILPTNKETASDESKEEAESAEGAESTEAGDPELLDELDDQLDELEASAGTADAKTLVDDGVKLIEQYEEIGDENGLVPEASEKIRSVLDIITSPAISYCETIEDQHLGSSGYTEITGTMDPITEKVAALTEKGYTVDATEATEYADGLVGRMRAYYISAINEITSRDQWSRDEAWSYAEQAYSIQEDGKLVLFDESEKDDPLTLRYEYCFARITLKRCENGIADGSMTNEGAFNEVVAILDQTDYNLLVLQAAVEYGTAAGIDVTAYQNAYNAIADQLKSQGLTIMHTGENSGSTVDLQKFWYFNDLDGDTSYMVDIHNGTTQATRTWIRENIPAYFN